jgi:hypothetical protein
MGLAMWLSDHHDKRMTPPAYLKGSVQLDDNKFMNIEEGNAVATAAIVSPLPVISNPLSADSVYNLHETLIDGTNFDFSQLVGKVSLFVNVASK